MQLELLAILLLRLAAFFSVLRSHPRILPSEITGEVFWCSLWRLGFSSLGSVEQGRRNDHVVV